MSGSAPARLPMTPPLRLRNRHPSARKQHLGCHVFFLGIRSRIGVVLGVVCKDAWKNNYRGNSSSKPPVIYDSCNLPCAIAPVSLTRAASCYLPCAIAPVSLTRASSCYLSCVIAPVSLTKAASCYLPCVIAPVSLTRAASCSSCAPKRLGGHH